MTQAEIKVIQRFAVELRRDVVECVYRAKDGHPGPALGIADIVATLYGGVMNIDGANPEDPTRDRLVLSKGHSCPVVYAALAAKGYYSKELLPTLRAFGSELQGHPCITTPGIDMTSGSLGNGIPIALGMDIVRKLSQRDYYTYVITGDGELNEGVVWEGVMAAAHNKADHLIAFVDQNGFQSGGTVDAVSGITGIAEKFRQFGWHTQEIDGNDVEAVLGAIQAAKASSGAPCAIVCTTTKGKGVSYMENNNSWHKGVPSDEQYAIAMEELGRAYDEL